MTRKPKIVDMTPDYGHGGLGKEVNQNRILMDSNRSLDVSHIVQGDMMRGGHDPPCCVGGDVSSHDRLKLFKLAKKKKRQRAKASSLVASVSGILGVRLIHCDNS